MAREWHTSSITGTHTLFVYVRSCEHVCVRMHIYYNISFCAKWLKYYKKWWPLHISTYTCSIEFNTRTHHTQPISLSLCLYLSLFSVNAAAFHFWNWFSLQLLSECVVDVIFQQHNQIRNINRCSSTNGNELSNFDLSIYKYIWT